MMRSRNRAANRATRPLTILVGLIIGTLLLIGCSQADEPATLRLALLPILDALPMYVAEEQGYFEEEDLTVEFIPVTSAAERDQIIQW